MDARQYQMQYNNRNFFFDRFPIGLRDRLLNSNLTQRDLVNIMTVCQRWQRHITFLTRPAWRRLIISPNSFWNTTSLGMRMNLGPHVREVSILGMFNTTQVILKRLHRVRCRIKKLILQDSFDISEASFIPLFNRTIALLDSIKLFGQSITELCISDHRYHLPVCHLLKELPVLTHLTLLLNEEAMPQMTNSGYNGLAPDDRFDNLVFLHVNSYHSRTNRSFHSQMLPLLRRCLNLRCLVTSTTELDTPEIPNVFPYEKIFRTCQKIRYIAWNIQRWTYDTIYNQPDGRLHSCNNVTIKNRYQIIEQQAETNPRHDIPTLRPVSLEALTLRGKYGLAAARGAWIDTLLREYCQYTKYLALEITDMDNQLLQTVNNAIHSFGEKRIQYLILHHLRGEVHNYIEHQLPILLELEGLQFLCLKNINIIFTGLNAVRDHQALQEFHVHFDDETRHPGTGFTAEELTILAYGIRFTNIYLQKLTLTGVSDMNDAVLEQLSHSRVSLVRISNNTNVTEEGRAVFTRAVLPDVPERRIEILQHAL